VALYRTVSNTQRLIDKKTQNFIPVPKNLYLTPKLGRWRWSFAAAFNSQKKKMMGLSVIDEF